jgi:uncharacterized membrane protein YraQ (UPF0718 family)
MTKKQKRRRKLNIATLVLFVIASALLIIAVWKGRDLPWQGLKTGGLTLWRNLPLLLLSFVVAGLTQILIPKDLITEWLGVRSGLRGVLIGSIVGGLVPGSPYAVFPIVGAIYQGGASLGAVISFVSAWGLLSVTRLPTEMALIDPKAALLRFGISFVLPPIAGVTAYLLEKFIEI